MKLRSISAVSLKGSSFEQPLAAVTLLHGKNFVGKSTRVEALALALTHKVPGAFEAPRDVFEGLASGNPLTVQCEADDGSFAGAEWARDRKGKVSTTFEGGLEAPALLFCTNEFLELSARERTRFLFKALPPPPLDKVRPDVVVAALKNVKCDPHTEAHEKAVNELADNVRQSWGDAGLDGGDCKLTVQEWLEALVEQVATTTKEAKASAKTMRQTALGTTALRQDAPALGLVEARKRKAMEDHTAAVAAERSAFDDFTVAERLFQQAKAQAAGYTPLTAQEQSARTRLAAERAELAEWLQREDVERPEESNTREAAALADANSKLAAAKQALDRARRAVEEFDRLECCPTCKARAKGWKDAVLASLTKDRDAAEAEAARLKPLYDAALKAKREADKRVEDQALHRQGVRSHRDRLAAVDRELAALKEREDRAAPAREADSRLPALETASMAAGNAHNAAKARREAAAKALGEADEAHRAAVADAASARQAQQARERAEELDAKAEVGQALRDLLGDLLAECVKRSVGPLLDLCNDLCGGILPAPVEFVDGEVVLRGKGPSHRTMSGTEKALLYCALSVGLAAKAPLRLVVLDELSRLDRANKVALLCRLDDLIKQNKLDQAILVDVEPMGAYFKDAPPDVLEVEVKGDR